MVERLLVTGPEQQMMAASIAVGMVANFIERRGNTCICTVMSEDYEAVLDALKRFDLTIQRGQDTEPFWPVIHRGSYDEWRPPERTDGK